MSVSVGLSLVEAFSALTGVEYIARAGELMVAGTGKFSGITLQSAAQILQASGAKYVGDAITVNAATIEAGTITGYQALNSTWNIANAGYATPVQLSPGIRAALQNTGSQIGSTALQPITDIAVETTASGSKLAVTSKGALATTAFETALYGAAAALGVTIGVGVVETNPELVTKIYNKFAKTDIDPEYIGDIVRNTTVWENIRDGVTFLSEDFINAVKEVFLESNVYLQGINNPKITVAPGDVNVFLPLPLRLRYTRRYDYKTRYLGFVWNSGTIETQNSLAEMVAIICTASSGPTAGIYAKKPFTIRGNFYQYEEASGHIDGEGQPTERVAGRASNGIYYVNYGYAYSYGSVYDFEARVGIGVTCLEVSAGTNPANAAYNYFYNGDTSNVITPSYPAVEGTSLKPNITIPVSGRSLAEDFPGWGQHSVETVDGWDDETDSPKKRKWFPVSTNLNDESSQLDGQDGTIPDDDTITKLITIINNAIEENLNNQEDTDPKPDTYPQPNPEPGTDLQPVTPDPPDIDASDGEDPDPTIPTLTTVATSGLAHIYNPTLAEVRQLGGVLWSSNFMENLKKIFVNPMDGIIGFHILYATPKVSDAQEIVLGYYGTGVNSKVVTNQYVTVDCGFVAVDEWWNDARDYEPYVDVSLYLPFIGIVPLKANDIINSHVKVKYHVDVLTGTCLAMVEIAKFNSSGVLYQFVGNCAVTIPLSSGNYTAVITSLLAVASSAVGGAAIGGAAGAAFGALKGLAINGKNARLQVVQSGNLGANAGAMGIRKPFLIIRRPITHDAYAYNMQYGYPAFRWVTLGQLKGFTRVRAAYIDNLLCTGEEKRMIDAALKEGVIL